jgi:mono/diheme cytochrome c family protein
MRKDFFVAEPVGRVIKRGHISNTNGKIQIGSVYKEKDWLASADPNVRPLNTYTGPDGCFYIVDMYHGIIQESEWSGPGTYLGGIIKDKQLYKNRGMGRIYRVVHDDFSPDKKRPNMLNETAAQLLQHLEHPNGWWRDNAQMLLVMRNDQSVVPALKEIALGGKSTLSKKPNEVTRIHALWTLQGINAMNKDILFKALDDRAPQIRKAAVWISEMYRNDPQVTAKVSSMTNDPSPDVRVQLALTLRTNNEAKAQSAVKELLAKNKDNELMQYSYNSFIKTREDIASEEKRIKNISPAERNLVLKGAVIFKQLCATCHGADGKGKVTAGTELPAPPLAGSPRLQGEDRILPVEVLLHGLKGPIDGKTYKDMMPSMAGQSDEWIAAVLSYVRNSGDLGNKSSVITPEEVKKVRSETKIIPGGATLQQLEITKHYRGLKRNFAE